MKFLTVVGLMERYGICRTTAKTLPIPFVRIGKRRLRRYPMKAVERYELLHSSRPSEWEESVA